MWLMWSGESRFLPSQQLGDRIVSVYVLLKHTTQLGNTHVGKRTFTMIPDLQGFFGKSFVSKYRVLIVSRQVYVS